MKLIICLMLVLLIIGIAASESLNNSTGDSMILGGISKNITNQTNNSISQVNITKQLNNSNQTKISVARSVFGSNGIDRTAMATPIKAAFESEPTSFHSNATVPRDEDSAIETPAQASFNAFII